MLFAFICKDKPGILQVRLDNRPAHVAYLEKLNAEGTLKFAGPFLGDDGKPNGSLVVVEAADKAAARRSSPRTPTPRQGCSRRPKSASGTGRSTSRPCSLRAEERDAILAVQIGTAMRSPARS